LGAARRKAHPQPLREGETAYPAKEDQWDRKVVEQLALRRLLHAVARRDVRDLVGDYARHLGLVIGGFEQTAVDVKEPAGQRESVDLLGVDHFDRERDFGVGMEHYVLRDAVDVFGDDRVVVDLGGAVDLGGELASYGHLFFDRIELYRPLIDVALADQRRIILFIQRLRQRFL